MPEEPLRDRCPDCGSPIGSPHRDGCDVERCPLCGGQRISCGCDNEGEPHSEWTELWPGVEECREFGWWAKLVPGEGWKACGADDPEATEDLTRLRYEARWDRERQRWVRKAFAE